MCNVLLKNALICIGVACIFMLCPAVLYPAAAREADQPVKTFRKQYTIFFKINKWDIDTTFRGNGETIRKMHRELDSLIGNGIISTDSISIVSAASPDGRNAFNIWLSEKRGHAARALLEEKYPGIDPEIIFVDPVGEDWSTFRKVVHEDKDIPARDELIELMESDDLSADEKERRLRQMKPTFRYILHHYIHLMRASSVTFDISMPLITLAPVQKPAGPSLEIY